MPKASPTGATVADKLQFGKLSIDEASDLSGLGKTTIYEKIRSGEWPVEKHGARSLFDGPTLLRILRGTHGKAA
jgi:excisionase family DNA binding protein